MTNLSASAKLLSEYPRAIAHLRWQVQKRRFGLVVGSGVSIDLGVPGWEELVRLIACDKKVDGLQEISGENVRATLPYKTEMLYQRFREKHSAMNSTLNNLERENTIGAEWRKLCQKYLYPTSAPDPVGAINSHPYLKSLTRLVQRSLLTINFNFDDFLEIALERNKMSDDRATRGFEAVTDPWPQFRRTDSVVYHPHGYIPREPLETLADRFVFSEASYSQQYVGARGQDGSFLVAHFARNTCLLVGCSLEDELRHVLMRGAEFNPGNYHYYVKFEGNSPLTDDQKKLVWETNFKVYNLITLFLTSQEIEHLLQLINDDEVSNDHLKRLALNSGTELKYTYYMTGALGVGKSTTTERLRNLHVMDEWQDAKPAILGKAWDTLSPRERERADAWIVAQFVKKNQLLRELDGAVVSVVDRPPLDPIAFTPHQSRRRKAKTLKAAMCPDAGDTVERGVVILLVGQARELSARVRARGRADYNVKRLEKMQRDLSRIYDSRRVEGVRVVDTTFMNITDVTKRVAEIIHRETYTPADLTQVLNSHGGA